MLRSEQDNLLQRKALEFLKIDINEWNKLTKEDRKKNYHKKIMKAILENHPDRHADLAKDSPEFNQFNENTKLLNSISYDYDVALSGVSNVSVNPTRQSGYYQSSNMNDQPTSSSSVFDMTPPRTEQELISGLERYSYGAHNNKLGSIYYQAFKEYIPNLVPWEHWAKLQHMGVGNDYGFVVAQIATKMYLQNYKGADVFVSAMVSQDNNRIKAAFDLMVSNLKNRNFFMAFFAPSLDQFIGEFCKFTPVGGKGGIIAGVDAYTVLSLCKALSLNLPYNIIDPHFDMDQDLIRALLTKYVKGESPALRLQDGKTTSLPIEEKKDQTLKK